MALSARLTKNPPVYSPGETMTAVVTVDAADRAIYETVPGKVRIELEGVEPVTLDFSAKKVSDSKKPVVAFDDARTWTLTEDTGTSLTFTATF